MGGNRAPNLGKKETPRLCARTRDGKNIENRKPWSRHAPRSIFNALAQAIRALVGLVFLLDLDAICQHLPIHRIRCLLLARKLYHQISEKAADMIAVVDLEGSRFFHGLPYRKVLGSLLEAWQTSSAFEQTQPRERGVEKRGPRCTACGTGKILDCRFRHKAVEFTAA
jgi:hypothetical protein